MKSNLNGNILWIYLCLPLFFLCLSWHKLSQKKKKKTKSLVTHPEWQQGLTNHEKETVQFPHFGWGNRGPRSADDVLLVPHCHHAWAKSQTQSASLPPHAASSFIISDKSFNFSGLRFLSWRTREKDSLGQDFSNGFQRTPVSEMIVELKVL